MTADGSGPAEAATAPEGAAEERLRAGAADQSGASPGPGSRGFEAQLLDAVEQAVIATDAEGRILFWNRFAEWLYGWPAAEVLGRDVTQVVPSAASAEQAGQIMAALRRCEHWQGEFEVFCRDGSTFTAMVTDSPLVVDGQVVGVVGVSVDVTERRAIEESLRASERRLRALFESIDEGYCLAEMLVDDTGVATDYRFLEVNPLFEEMTGLKGAVGRTALELVPDLEPVWVQTYARVGVGRETLRFEQGSAAMGRWFDVFAVPVDPAPRFAIVFKDETTRRQTEDALRESEQRFRAMADGLPLLVWQHGPDGTLDWVNQTYCDFFGVDRDEMVADRWQALTDPGSGPPYAEAFVESVSARTPFRGQVMAQDSQGRWRWLQSWAEPRFSAAGEYLGHLGVSADITDRKAAEDTARADAELDGHRAHLLDALRSVSDPRQIQALACRLLGEHLGASGVHYAQILQDGSTCVVEAGYDAGATRLVGTYRLDQYGAEVMGRFRAGDTVVVDDAAHDPRLDDEERAATLTTGVHAYVMAPLTGQGGPVAALITHQDEPRSWTAHDLAAIDITAERTWAAVEQARAYQAARTAHRRAELVADVVGALEAESSAAGQLQALVEALVPRLADYATVEAPGHSEPLRASAHRDPARAGTLQALRSDHRVPADAEGSVSHAAAGRAQLISQVTPTLVAGYDLGPQAADLLAELAPHSHMAVPLNLEEGTAGALVVGLGDPDRDAYTPDDLAFLQEVAHRADVILTATRLRRREHDIAVRLQRAMLPDHLVQDPRLRIAARYEAAGDMLEVGGDWYDTFTWPSGHIGLVVGDVVGHNLESAAAMGRLRAATAAIAAHVPPDPAALLDAINAFAAGSDGTDFTTAVCVLVDPATGRLSYASAGHPPPLLVEASGRTTWLDRIQQPPLGTGAGAYRRTEAHLPEGGTLVLYSDGLVERRHEAIDIGLERLRTAVAVTAPRTPAPDALAEHLLRNLTEGTRIEDDIVLVCAGRRTPAAPSAPGSESLRHTRRRLAGPTTRSQRYP
ncbi:MAG: SpoIIE family protein phosphatase [Actinobacteria bacterium]|nr:SpoIIE family protein phosphatase [Actinomycetota bacterium]